jgi:hypothetical protein
MRHGVLGERTWTKIREAACHYRQMVDRLGDGLVNKLHARSPDSLMGYAGLATQLLVDRKRLVEIAWQSISFMDLTPRCTDAGLGSGIIQGDGLRRGNQLSSCPRWSATSAGDLPPHKC